MAGVALIAIAGAIPTASASPTTFSYSGSIVDYTIPVTGLYHITAAGAQGGNGMNALGLCDSEPYSGSCTFSTVFGGRGAVTSGELLLAAGDELQILAGSQGGSNFLVEDPNALYDPNFTVGGGGGGSFVALVSSTATTPVPLVVAGGGGGGGTAGGGGGTAPAGNGGYGIGGGGGYYTNGAIQYTPFGFVGAGGGASFLNGGQGGFGSDGSSNGGFGGGGGSFQPTSLLGDFGYLGGGGGGYSGGNANGGGGGSYLDPLALDPMLTAAINSGDGYVTITLVDPVPEPGSLALLASGLIGLLALRRRRGWRSSPTGRPSIDTEQLQ